ncbi:hypothetical protein MAPG_01373 [Magnaporthiopsis poae ATCC 64411]|uniref:SUN domain-containing protein n=1 Tax=Magnaporthiopsis poae (strain ATCC 64411 / 73-15) TaxID=644358 RepID=A0A0C4DNI6_MAGP6|nr:hypothetical protein MAPG_01373 [Magnaporthiopsis poae ATCC 64411]
MPPKATPKPPTLGERRRTNLRGDSRASIVEDEIEVNASPAPTRASARVRAAANMNSGLTPRPQRHSTNYGAPAFTAASPENPAFIVQDTDLQSGIARAINRVQRDNREDQEARASRAPSVMSTRPRLEETANSRNRLATAPPESGRDRLRQSPLRTIVEAERPAKRKSPTLEDSPEPENSKRQRISESGAASPRRSPERTTGAAAQSRSKTNGSTRRTPGRPRGRPPRSLVQRDVLREVSVDEPRSGSSEPPEDDVDMLSENQENQPVDQAVGPGTAKQSTNTTGAPTQSAGAPTTKQPVSAPTQRDTLYPDLSRMSGSVTLATTYPATDMPPTSGDKIYWHDLPVTRANANRLNELRNSGVPQTPANGAGGKLKVMGPPVQSSAAPTERSFNLESGLFQRATLQTPPPQQTSIGPTPSTVPASSLPPSSVAQELPPRNHLPPGAPAWTQGERQEPPAIRTQTYSWFADPPHRGVRSSSAEPGSSRYIATHIDHDLVDNAKLREPRQRRIENDHSDDEATPRKATNTSLGSPIKSGLVNGQRRERARTEEPEFTSRVPAGFVTRPVRSAFAEPDPKAQSHVHGGTGPSGKPELRGTSTTTIEVEAASAAAAARNRRAQADKELSPNSTETQRPDRYPGRADTAYTTAKGTANAQSSDRTHVGSSSNWTENIKGLARQFRKSFDCKTLAKTMLYFALAIVTMSWIFSWLSGPTMFEGHELDTGLHWYGTSDWRHNLGQFVPSWPFRRVVLSDDNYGNLKEAWESHEQVIARLKRQDEMTTAAISRLEHALPNYIRVDRDKQGNAIIPNDFWRALKAFARQDGDFVILDEKKAITDPHWKPFEARLDRAGDFETWVRQNKDKLRDIVGAGQGQQTPGPDVDELIRKRLEEQNLPDKLVVMKKEFVDLIKEEYKANARSVKADIAALQRNNEELSKKLERLSKSSAGGVTADEVRRITQKELRKAIGDLQLGSLAKGRMHDPLIADLKSRVNYFGPQSGAYFDPHLSSPTFKFKYPRFGTPEWKVQRPWIAKHASTIMQAWEDDGDCWCAGGTWDSKRSRPKPADIYMGVLPLIPQVLWMEHIHPQETMDDGSMPRDVEVWIEVEEYGQRNTLRDWSMATFPHTDMNERLWDNNFVKVIEFEFKNQTAGGPVEKAVRFPSQLNEFGIATDRVLIRAVSNYGARDHTCFYRVKLFGEQPPAEQQQR